MSGSCFTISITDASQINNERLRKSNLTPFVTGDFSKRVDPKKVFPGAKSIIVVCVPYVSKKFYSNLSSLGVCDDYHKRVRDVLRATHLELTKNHGASMHKILVDSPTLCERSLAVRAGLGFFGKNGLVISPEFGSRFNIGVMLTDISFDGVLNALDLRLETNHLANALRARRSTVSFKPFALSMPTGQVNQNVACSVECDLCIKACPNGAIIGGKPLDTSRCISYLTQKESLTDEEKKLLHGQLYGCDICQNACPKNEAREASYVSPQEILRLSDCEISEKFGHTAMNWKIKLLKRNALISDIASENCLLA